MPEKDEKINELLERGVEKIIDKDHLCKALMSGKKLRVKLGIDPTGPKIHIGRSTQLLKLRDFEDLGHQIVLIFGDFTAQIGDASDKDSMRKPLTESEVKDNMKDYMNQVGKILDIKKIEVRHNNEWLSKLSAKDLLALSMHFTAQQMIQRRNFKERWEGGKAIGIHELSYPLLQGYDSVAIKADIEIGGYDQLFNLTTGREVQKIFNKPSQDIMTTKMIYGLDGRKMSTSWCNVINILDPPNEMYGKIMSLKDELIIDYLELCTRYEMDEIKKMKEEMKEGKINPKDLKSILAKEIIALYHGRKDADDSEKEFERVFKEKKLPSEMEQVEVKEKSLNIIDLLVKTNIASSKSEAKRLISQKGIKIDGEVKDDADSLVEIKKGMVIQSGRRKFVKII